ncbi:MAG: hypothetical protein AAF547_21635, partial [Actinomycetota bacterium]
LKEGNQAEVEWNCLVVLAMISAWPQNTLALKILPGIALAPFVGWLLSRILAGVTELAVRLAGPPAAVVVPAGLLVAPADASFRSTLLGDRARSRAPPVLRHS